MGRWSSSPPAHHVIETGCSRRSFRVCACARHHPWHAPAASTALQKRHPIFSGLLAEGDRVQASPAPTRSTLIRVRRFNHRLTPAGTGHHSGSYTPCAVSRILRCSSHVGQDPWSESARYGRGSRPGIVSGPEGPISRARIQKLSSTHPEQTCPDSAPSLLRLTGKGLRPLSSLSFSRSAFSRIPGGGQPPAGRCCHRPAPDASARCTNLSSLAPDWPNWAMVRVPWGD
jgi:hypothetical protein